MSKTYRIIIPGAAFEAEMEAMRLRLSAFVAASDPIAFQIFFDHFALTAENQSLKRKLLNRGSFWPVGDGTYRNAGRSISHTLKNIGQNLDEVELFIPPDLHVVPHLSAPDISFSFLDSQPLIELSRTPPELGIGRRFVFVSLVWNTAGALYVFEEEDNSSNILELFVDVTQSKQLTRFEEDGSPLRLRSRLRLALAQTFSGGGCCSGFQVIEEPVPSGPLCFVLHAKILVPPATPIESQVQALVTTFASADISLSLGSVEVLALPQFEDLDVGHCYRGEVTAEQAALFKYRGGAGMNDICAYWVRTMTSATGTTIGCAAHSSGVPALALMGGAAGFQTPYVLAHEIGHVLGLAHTTSNCVPASLNLMNPCDSYSNPPPDLSPSEVAAMRSSGYRAGILRRC